MAEYFHSKLQLRSPPFILQGKVNLNCPCAKHEDRGAATRILTHDIWRRRAGKLHIWPLYCREQDV